jgi:hypothetical protein
MSTIHPECGNLSDQWGVADLILRQEPDEDEEEDDQKDDDADDDDDEDTDDGYSE